MNVWGLFPPPEGGGKQQQVPARVAVAKEARLDAG